MVKWNFVGFSSPEFSRYIWWNRVNVRECAYVWYFVLVNSLIWSPHYYISSELYGYSFGVHHTMSLSDCMNWVKWTENTNGWTRRSRNTIIELAIRICNVDNVKNISQISVLRRESSNIKKWKEKNVEEQILYAIYVYIEKARASKQSRESAESKAHSQKESQCAQWGKMSFVRNKTEKIPQTCIHEWAEEINELHKKWICWFSHAPSVITVCLWLAYIKVSI